MTLSLKHVGLLTGIVFVFVSFLFFGRQQGIYEIFSIVGFIISLVFYLFILFGKENLRAKIFWIIVVIISTIVEQITQPFLIDTSYNIYINQNKETLTQINNILIQKKNEIIITKDTILLNGNQLTAFENNKLKEGRNKLNVYIITKSDNKIYYGLWGFLDVRLGITYFIDKNKQDNTYRHLTGNWFH